MKGVGYSPDMKCSRSEAINLYKGFVSHTKRDIHRAVLDKGPYSLSTPYSFLAVSDAVWSSMPRPEREKHLQKLGTSVDEAEELTQGNNDTRQGSLELMGKFEESGLPDFMRGSWSNTNQILELEGIVPFPKDPNKRFVISLTRPISHTVKFTGKHLACFDECP